MKIHSILLFSAERGEHRAIMWIEKRAAGVRSESRLAKIRTAARSGRRRKFKAALRFESAGALEIVRELQHAAFAEMRAENLHPDGQAFRSLATGNGDAG